MATYKRKRLLTLLIIHHVVGGPGDECTDTEHVNDSNRLLGVAHAAEENRGPINAHDVAVGRTHAEWVTFSTQPVTRSKHGCGKAVLWQDTCHLGVKSASLDWWILLFFRSMSMASAS